MYEILATVYGVKPSKDQIGKIRDHYDDWPSHLGESPYSGMGTDGEDSCVSNTEFIGVEMESIPTFEFYGTKVEDLGKGLTDEIKEKAKSACK